jgi:hypothetical protein
MGDLRASFPRDTSDREEEALEVRSKKAMSLAAALALTAGPADAVAPEFAEARSYGGG